MTFLTLSAAVFVPRIAKKGNSTEQSMAALQFLFSTGEGYFDE